MKPADAFDYRRAGAAPVSPPEPGRLRRLGRPMLLVALCILLLSLAFAPVSQCYLAWTGLVPFLVLIHERQSQRAVLLWGWFTGIVFILVNMWWLVFVTIPGTIALAAYLGLFFGLAAMLIRGCGLLDRELSAVKSLTAVALIATVWTALEWLRGSYSPFGAHGLPWLYLGYTQTPLLPFCQIADITGVYGVTFGVVLVNALLARLWIDQFQLARLRLATSVVSILILLAGAYGIFRMHQQTGRPGPTVLVVQPNYPQTNSGEKGADLDEIVNFHVSTTDTALQQCQAKGVKVDLVVWSETMMPAINRETREFMRGVNVEWNAHRYDYGEFIEDTSQQISGLADRYRTGFLVGGSYSKGWKWISQPDGSAIPIADDHRNSAYFFEPTGLRSAVRYDKIRLLPFGEFVPFKDGIPPLYRLLVSLGPPDMKYYELTPGDPEALNVFPLEKFPPRENNAATQPSPPVQSTAVQNAGVQSAGVHSTDTFRFVTPICFEDIVAPLVTDLFHGNDGTKRADFIVNITNDGWFKANERTQHLQAAAFRSIENRVPTARSVNTGVSGFVDPCGRVSGCVAAGTEGWAVHTLTLDSRVTFYTRFGDLFVHVCGLITAGLVGWGLTNAWLGRKSRRVAGLTN